MKRTEQEKPNGRPPGELEPILPGLVPPFDADRALAAIEAQERVASLAEHEHGLSATHTRSLRKIADREHDALRRLIRDFRQQRGALVAQGAAEPEIEPSRVLDDPDPDPDADLDDDPDTDDDDGDDDDPDADEDVEVDRDAVKR